MLIAPRVEDVGPAGLDGSSVRRQAIAAVLFGMLWPNTAGGQVLRGRVVSAQSAQEVPGVVVVLQDSLRNEVARSLTASSGAFVLRATAPGTYRVRTLRIGFAPGDFGPYRLTVGADQSVSLPLRDVRISLEALRVVATSDCRRRDEGGDATLAVWEEARKALLLTVLARTDRRPAVVATTYERVLDPRSGRVVRQTVQRRTGVSIRPYASPLTADEYATRGYAEQDSGGTTYRAPDADVLLTDSFAASHCFHIVSSADSAGAIGLAFRPTARRPAVVDVQGTLWVDRATSKLRTLEFQYVGLDPRMTNGGGHVSFVGLPVGIWMIDQWQIVVPRSTTTRRFETTASGSLADNGTLANRPTTRRAVAELWEFGGRLSSVRLDDQVVWRGPTARLAGVVMDAGSGAPVRAANVSLRATEYSTRTDSAGRFVLDDVLPARYQVDVESPSVASLGLDGSATESVDLRDTGTVTVALRTPALRDAVTRACAGEHPGTYNTKGGLLRGTIRQPDGTPASGATVLARWLGHVDLQGSGVVGVSAQELHATTIVGADGAFRLCGVDLGRPIRLIATRDSLRSPLAIAWLSDTTLVTSVDLTLAGQKTAVPPDALP